MDKQLDRLVKEVTRGLSLHGQICIHFPNEMREKGLKALDRYGFVLCTESSLVDNPRLNSYNWFCLRTSRAFVPKKGLYVTTVSEDLLNVRKDIYKVRIRAEEYVYSNFRRYQ